MKDHRSYCQSQDIPEPTIRRSNNRLYIPAETVQQHVSEIETTSRVDLR